MYSYWLNVSTHWPIRYATVAQVPPRSSVSAPDVNQFDALKKLFTDPIIKSTKPVMMHANINKCCEDIDGKFIGIIT